MSFEKKKGIATSVFNSCFTITTYIKLSCIDTVRNSFLTPTIYSLMQIKRPLNFWVTDWRCLRGLSKKSQEKRSQTVKWERGGSEEETCTRRGEVVVSEREKGLEVTWLLQSEKKNGWNFKDNLKRASLWNLTLTQSKWIKGKQKKKRIYSVWLNGCQKSQRLMINGHELLRNINYMKL